jgi:hypothetical protein
VRGVQNPRSAYATRPRSGRLTRYGFGDERASDYASLTIALVRLSAPSGRAHWRRNDVAAGQERHDRIAHGSDRSGCGALPIQFGANALRRCTGRRIAMRIVAPPGPRDRLRDGGSSINGREQRLVRPERDREYRAGPGFKAARWTRGLDSRPKPGAPQARRSSTPSGATSASTSPKASPSRWRDYPGCGSIATASRCVRPNSI